MAGKRRDAAPTFAEVVAELPEASGVQSVPMARLAQESEFIDAGGVRWVRRGELLEGRALHKAVLDQAVQVLHDDGGDVSVVEPHDRERFWVELQERMRASSHATSYGATFRGDSRARLLVVEENC